MYIWLAYLPVAIASGLGFLKYNSKEAIVLERRVQKEDYKVILQITTRGFNTDAIERSVRSILYWAPKYLKDYEIWIVTEDDVDKKFFERLKELNDEAKKKIRTIYVPRSYKTPNNTKYKARALNYALELRLREKYNLKKTWIYAMDEESIVGEDTIIGIIDFIENKSKNGKLIGQGLIVYSNFWGKNILTSLEDSIRTGDDISRFRFQAEYGEVIVGAHGSHSLYRADLEAKIGWDFGEVRAEDALFGVLANKYFPKPYGWLKGKLYEQSPFSVIDFLKQRRRWFWGKLDILLNRKDIDLKYKALFAIGLISWLSALPSQIITYVNLLHPTPSPNLLAAGLFGFNLGTLIYIYWIGCKLNLQPIEKDSIWIKTLNILAIPVISITEGLAPWYALLTYRNSKKMAFEVIKK
ncbi:MAG TPA: hypothetical protein EYH22_02840 [Candidatus Nanopusillus sp.]|nr:hypothetical protein [Candidatus Nanopusillus sp.]